MITAHMDVVGSLLRPPELLRAREDAAGGRLSRAGLKAAEDRAVDAAVALQEEAGLAVVTDGEMRRLSFQSQMTEAVEGFGECGIDAFLWGDWRGGDRVGDKEIRRPASLGVVGRLQRKRHLSAEEFTVLRAITRGKPLIPKVTLPSPGLWMNFWPTDRRVDAYPTLDSFLADVVDILRGEVAELVRLGATYIQIDAPQYTAALDPKGRAFYESRGWSGGERGEEWLSRGIEMDNAVMDGFPDVTIGFHL